VLQRAIAHAQDRLQPITKVQKKEDSGSYAAQTSAVDYDDSESPF
jgi:hypothetical protein